MIRIYYIINFVIITYQIYRINKLVNTWVIHLERPKKQKHNKSTIQMLKWIYKMLLRSTKSIHIRLSNSKIWKEKNRPRQSTLVWNNWLVSWISQIKMIMTSTIKNRSKKISHSNKSYIAIKIQQLLRKELKVDTTTSSMLSMCPTISMEIYFWCQTIYGLWFHSICQNTSIKTHRNLGITL